MSEKTGALATIHSPLGRPGGPGLFHDKALQLPAYIQNIAKALIRQGHDKSRAIQLAIGAVRRWARGGDNVSPEVRAAAGKALAAWEALKAEARAKPNKSDHSSDAAAVELAQARRPKGNQGGGQWYGEPRYPAEARTVEVPKVTADNVAQFREQLQGLTEGLADLPPMEAAALARDLALASTRLAEQAIELASTTSSTGNAMEKAAKAVKPAKGSVEDRLHKKLVAKGMDSAKARRFAKRAAARFRRAKREKITGPSTPAAASMSNDGGNVVELAKVAPALRAKARQKAAKAGTALPDGSFPVRGKGELGKAIQAWGRANPGKRARVKRHLLKRARALGAGPKVIDRIKALKAA